MAARGHNVPAVYRDAAAGGIFPAYSGRTAISRTPGGSAGGQAAAALAADVAGLPAVGTAYGESCSFGCLYSGPGFAVTALLSIRISNDRVHAAVRQREIQRRVRRHGDGADAVRALILAELNVHAREREVSRHAAAYDYAVFGLCRAVRVFDSERRAFFYRQHAVCIAVVRAFATAADGEGPGVRHRAGAEQHGAEGRDERQTEQFFHSHRLQFSLCSHRERKSGHPLFTIYTSISSAAGHRQALTRRRGSPRCGTVWPRRGGRAGYRPKRRGLLWCARRAICGRSCAR